jgi:hypothetical protein
VSAQNQVEPQFVQNLLRDAGVPSVLRRSGGADVPDFRAAGRRDVLVPASLAEIARDALTRADLGTSARVEIRLAEYQGPLIRNPARQSTRSSRAGAHRALAPAARMAATISSTVGGVVRIAHALLRGERPAWTPGIGAGERRRTSDIE